jgi:hypothetical protein
MPSSGRIKAGRRPAVAAKSLREPLPLVVVGAGLFLLSAASLAFEVILTHLYSLVFQYHYAFLAVSTAILGLGLGAAAGYRLPKTDPDRLPAWLSQAAAVFGVAIPLAVILFTLTGFMPGIIWQAILGALPFGAVGLLTARLYAAYSEKAAWLYAFDLAGAAFGLLGVQALLDLASAASAGFVLGLLAGFAALLFSLRRARRPGLAFSALGLAGAALVLNLVTHFADLPQVFTGSVPPDKTMFNMLADPAQKGKVVDSAWSAFARVDLVSTTDPNQMFAFTNAGAGSYMIRFDGDLAKVKWLQGELEYLPFINFTPARTLVLGAGAGKDVLQALLAGSKSITAIEINPAMVAITRKYASYDGDIFDYPGVQTVVGDGRAFIDRSPVIYDMIYLNLVYAQAPAPASNALSEAYMFTTQAFQAYWQHLAPDGRLAIISHQGIEGSRALITAIKAMSLDGISPADAMKHSALLMYTTNDPNQATTVMVVQKSPLTSDQVTQFGQNAQAMGMQPLFLPGVFETLFQGLASGKDTLEHFLSVDQSYNFFPTGDDRPFFFAIDPGLPQPLVILLVVALLGVVLYLLLSIGVKSKPSSWHMAYFGGLGLGFMLIEIPLIQRTLLLVGSPTAAMAVVLVALLLSGGAGSYLSSRWDVRTLWPRLAAAAALVALLAAALAFWQPALVTALGSLDAAGRTLLGGVVLLPLGFLMGMPFANGLRLAGQGDARVLPYLWGWNALTSVLGSALAAILGMQFGFGVGILAGAACYVLVTVAAMVKNHEGN